MKKSRKLMLRLIPVFLVLTVICTSSVNVFAIVATQPVAGSGIANINNMANNIWGTVATIIQILAIAAIILAGVRYMFASADEKADIKKQTVILVVGAILVFAAVPIAQWIGKTANSVFTTP